MSASIPATVLARYTPALTGIRWTSVSGGFSGADVWRGDDAASTPVFALKAWPAATTSERLRAIHVWMKRAAQLPFVPAVLRTADGDTLVSHGEQVWDVTHWMPGEPVSNPNASELETACVAVARLHRAWPVERVGVCPGVLNRLRLLGEFRARYAAERSRSFGSEALDVLARRAWQLVAERLDWTEQQLRPWETVRVPLQPCVRDLRAEHVLFSQGKVGGIVDYGAMAIDHPAGDLARLFGEFGVKDEGRLAGLMAYRNETGLPVSEEFVRILEQTGAVCSAVNWLLRLLSERRIRAGEATVLSRFRGLLAQIELFAPK